MDNTDVVIAGAPSPRDFDVFLPWACYELSLKVNVMVHRSVQKQYVSAVVSDRAKAKSKSKSRSSSPTETIVASGELKTNSALAQSAMDMEPCIRIESIYDTHLNLLQIKFLNNRTIPRQIMKIIGFILPFHKHLTAIVINSGLQVEAMYEMAKILPISRITELRLDNTFLAEANYSVLLGQNNLKHLSLSKCKINDAVVKTIAARLVSSCPASNTLSALNMATNRITDLGAKYLAEALRSNRHLSYLNLADNMITDKGAIHIFDTLIDFVLNEEELADVRRRYINYLKEYNDAMNAMAKEIRTGDADKKTVKRKSIKSSGNPTKKNKTDKDTFSLDSKGLSQDTLKIIKSEHTVERKLGPFIDPFCPNNTEKRDGVTYCYGNNTLCYLNLAYNNLTYFSIKKLYEVLLTQNLRARTPKGLANVRIEGNILPLTCKEYEEIDDLIGSGLQLLKTISEGVRKKATNSSGTTSAILK